MVAKSAVELRFYQWLFLISSLVVTTLQPNGSSAAAQTLPVSTQNLDGLRTTTTTTTESSARSTRLNSFASTSPSGFMMAASTGDPSAAGSSTRHTQTPPTTIATTAYNQLQIQPKSLKFTLISGKHWKFNIKTNSLQTSHVEKELRLHRNISSGNYIIDDDGWFQYNHHQQQLFAWPSLSVKPDTYYFVLLPSGLDYEAGGENAINVADVVANIVVELIKPSVGGKVSARLDLDQLIDFKFSLNYLHRHSSYPLLLSQIVSIFDLLSRASTNNIPVNSELDSNFLSHSSKSATTRSLLTSTQSSSSSSASSIATTTTTAPQQNKQARLTGKFTEFLLVDSNATQDGEFFSITWTIHPSLINNTIVPIGECRLSMINDTVSKLSSRSVVLDPTNGDKFVISYALEGPLVNSRAIIPTELGNYALKLSLHNSCRIEKVLDELGKTSAHGFLLSVGDRDKKIPAESSSKRESIGADQVSKIVSLEHTSTPSTSPYKEIASEQVQATPENLAPTTSSEAPTIVVPTISSPASARSDQRVTLDLLQSLHSTRTTTESSGLITTSSSVQLATGWPPSPGSQSKPEPLLQVHTRPIGTSALPSTTSGQQDQRQQRHQPKLQPQTKTFDSFLDSSMDPVANVTMPLLNTTTKTAISNSSLTDDPLTSTLASVTGVSKSNSAPTISKSGQESSLNDDLIGILNEITELLVSIAIPLAVVLGIVLVVSILIAICNLCLKRRKSKQFEVGDRFKFRYGSERKGFLKKRSKPVILEADQKSLSMGGTPRHQPLLQGDAKSKRKDSKTKVRTSSNGGDFFAMCTISADHAGHSNNCAPASDGAPN